MFRGRSIAAMIPARGGSKRFPEKNIKPLRGKPLIAWTIEQALKSRYIDRVIVSTDDEKIAGVARRYGAEVPFRRPRILASDKASGVDVAIHALQWLKSKGGEFDLFMVLQPTSPLRLSRDIDASIELLFKKSGKSVVSVCRAEHHVLWTNLLPPNHSMKHFLRDGVANRNWQDLPKYYRLNGAIYVAFSDYLMKKRSFIAADTYAYIMPGERSVDIDTVLDLRIAEAVMKENG